MIIRNQKINSSFSLRKLKRMTLMVTLLASVLSVYTVSIFIISLGYSGDTKELVDNQSEIAPQITMTVNDSLAGGFISKSKVDSIGLALNTLELSKVTANKDTFNIDNQVKLAEEAKIREQELKAQNTAQLSSMQLKLAGYTEPTYDYNDKLVINSVNDALKLDIRIRSNWDREDFEAILNTELYPLVDVALKMEDELGINAVYLVAIGSIETDYGRKMAGRNNFFNWSTDGIYHYNFNNTSEFYSYSLERYSKDYTNPEFYRHCTSVLGYTPKTINISVVNTVYAKYQDGSINWRWSTVLADVMATMSNNRINLSEKV